MSQLIKPVPLAHPSMSFSYYLVYLSFYLSHKIQTPFCAALLTPWSYSWLCKYRGTIPPPIWATLSWEIIFLIPSPQLYSLLYLLWNNTACRSPNHPKYKRLAIIAYSNRQPMQLKCYRWWNWKEEEQPQLFPLLPSLILDPLEFKWLCFIMYRACAYNNGAEQ